MAFPEHFNASFAVITLSDKGAAGQREDTSGSYLKEQLQKRGFTLCCYQILPDSKELIVETLKRLADEKQVGLILTTGGTGLSPRDLTPEAMAEILDLEIPGIVEAMRSESLKKTSRAMLSRGKAGVRGTSLIINFPGSLKAVRENLEVVVEVLPHAMEKIQGEEGDCGAG